MINIPNLSEILIYNGEIPLTVIIWSLFGGILIASIAAFIIKIKFGIFVQTLLKLNANSPETAVTLEETGLNKRFFVRRGLKLHYNYQNMIVAVTDDGRYYSNSFYTSQPPVFKKYEIKSRKRKKKSETKSHSEAEKTSDDQNTENVQESALAKRLRTETMKDASAEAEIITPSESEVNSDDNGTSHEEKYTEFVRMTEKLPKQRVKFDLDKAKFYIPEELHDRAASLYYSKPTKLIAVIGALLVLAIVLTFFETIINTITDLLEGFIESLSSDDTL